MKRNWTAVGAIGLGVILGLVCVANWGRLNTVFADDKPAREADRAAIRKVFEGFIKAFETSDAKALAGHLTADGEYLSDDGTVIRGRAALEKEYTKLFTDKQPRKVELESDTLRFLSKDTAVEEGFFKVRKDKPLETICIRYSVLFVREDGKWQMAVIREWPSEGVALRDVEWLVGSWTAKRADAEVSSSYEWDAKKKFLHGKFTIKGEDATHTGTQTIAKDASTGLLRSWTFEADGGFGEATWERDGKKWVIESKGVTPSGQVMTATNILTPIDHDSFTWHSVNRTLGGESLPDLPPIKVTRVKTKP